MKKKYSYLALDFVKNLRDSTVDESLRRSYGTVIEVILDQINLVDYLIYEREKLK